MPAVRETGGSHLENMLHKALQQMAGKPEHEPDHHSDPGKIFKRLDKLAHSLSRAFGEASEVKKDEGDEEIRKGGLKRIEKDLGKFFREMGMPKGLAKQFAQVVTGALGDGAEEVGFSFSASRSTSLSFAQQQFAYLASGDGAAMVGASAESFQVTAVQVQSFDFSINLRTGELSFTSSRSADISIESSQFSGVAAAAPLPAEQSPKQNVPRTTGMEPPASAPLTEAGTVAPGDLPDIRQRVERSSLARTQPDVMQPGQGEDEAPTSAFDKAIESMRQMVNSLDTLSGRVHDLFEPLVEISNLRVEQEDEDDHLRFSVDALAPIGLSTIDGTGHVTTLYPRQDGVIAKVSDPQIQATA